MLKDISIYNNNDSLYVVVSKTVLGYSPKEDLTSFHGYIAIQWGEIMIMN
jgi:hypothetical protein